MSWGDLSGRRALSFFLLCCTAAAAVVFGSGTANAGPVPSLAAHSGGRSVSFDGDTRDDLLIRDPAGGELSVRVGTGGDSTGMLFEKPQLIGTGWDAYRWFGAGDFNHDGFGDVAGVTPQGVMSIALNRGALDGLNTLAAPVVVAYGFGGYDLIYTGDVTGDGFDEVVARRTGSATSTYYPNRGAVAGTNTFAAGKPLITTASGVVDQRLVDITLDGRPDVVSIKANGELHVRDLSTGGAGTSYLLGRQLADATIGTFGDYLDGNGRIDILRARDRDGYRDEDVLEHRGFYSRKPAETYGYDGVYPDIDRENSYS